MKESMSQMMARINDGIPSSHWKQTSVGLVNFRNPSKVAIAQAELAELRSKNKDSMRNAAPQSNNNAL